MRYKYTQNCYSINFGSIFFMVNCSFSMFCATTEISGRSLPLLYTSIIFLLYKISVILFDKKNYWLALPIQLLESTRFALFWAAAVEFIHKTLQNKLQ